MNNGDSETVNGHVGGSTMFLTGVKPNESLSEINAGISVDQVVAKQFGEDFSHTKKKLGATDNSKLSEFTDALRDVELRVQKAESKVNMDLPDMARPIGIPEYGEHVRLMYDLMFMAFQTDMTLVFTFMIAREFSELVFSVLGHTDPFHPTTHHRGNTDKVRRAGDINVYQVKFFGEFLAKIKNTKDIDG
jgi:hypothetical protein